MAAIARMKSGQVLWSLRRHRMGNTTVSIVSLYPVKVETVAEDGNSVTASWNGNAPQRFGQAEARKWRVSKPTPKRTIMGMSDYGR